MGGTLLVDGDIYIYQAASGAEQEINWGGDLWTLHSRPEDAFRRFQEKLDGFEKTLEASRVIVALSHPDNFRYQVLPTYKGNRVGKRKPLAYAALREMVADQYETFLRPWLEADDVLGILATSKKLVPGRKIIVTEDKDLRTIPGLIFYSNHPEAGVEEIAPLQAAYQHMYQTLIGDTADGYSGCPGIGPKTATGLLDVITTPGDMWRVVVEAYRKKKLGKGEALIQARVARICQVEDYDFVKKEVILWNPPK